MADREYARRLKFTLAEYYTTPAQLREQLGVSEAEAREQLERFLKVFSALRRPVEE